MLDYLIYIVSFFITIPFVVTILIYLVATKLYHHKLKAIHTSVNWTTLLYIIAVSLMFQNIIGRSLIGWMIILFISALAIMIIFQWKSGAEVEFRKALKIVWRLSFLLFVLLYFALMLMGILKNIFM